MMEVMKDLNLERIRNAKMEVLPTLESQPKVQKLAIFRSKIKQDQNDGKIQKDCWDYPNDDVKKNGNILGSCDNNYNDNISSE